MLPHEAISASAGSGKTFQLAHRYLRLLAHGVPPDRIVALTFSRKAAGEIFESIVEHLCRAAGTAADAAQTAARIGQPELTGRDFAGMLRRLLDSLHRLHIGTLDSFIIGILRAFPAELGIAPDFVILENGSAAAAEFRREVLARMFNPDRLLRAPQREFLDAFRQATFGSEEKVLGERLDAFIEENRALFQRLPEAEQWGDEQAVWPRGSPWLAPGDPVDAAAEALWNSLVETSPGEAARERWRTFLDAARRFGPGRPWTREIEYLFEKLSAALDALRAGSAEIGIGRKKLALAPEQCRLALGLMQHVMQAELRAALQRTRGIHAILRLYETWYDDALRRTGKLTFSDAQYLLTDRNARSGGALLSRLPGEERRLYIDYRLDCRLDHWLLDEFQDTSDLQWSALANLASEILQDASGARSFFYVGDVKQSIYGWRGGNRRLFGLVRDQYRRVIREVPLNVSFRSGPAVIETVNAVFGRLAATEVPAAVVAEWSRLWTPHDWRRDRTPETGCAMLLEPVGAEDGGKPLAPDRHRLAARLLAEMKPLDRGLSVAVLVRTNDQGRAAVDVLRRECPGMTVVHEGNAPILDNPVVALLLSLVRYAAHPGDAFALRHLQMSPLGRWFGGGRDAPEDEPDRRPLELLREIEEDGFTGCLRRWGQRLDEACPLDPFGRLRREQLLRAAAEFDATGSRDADAFRRAVEGREISETAARHSIRVMTIHQSKGLGFDVVILPELMNRSLLTGDRPGVLLARDPESDRPRWALDMPRRLVCANDEVLSAAMDAFDREACFDALCVLYVALTRARHALYMITSFPGETSRAFTEAALLKQLLAAGDPSSAGTPVTIGGEAAMRLYERGDGRWFERFPVAQPAAEPAGALLPPGFADRPSRRRRLVQVEPSAEEETVGRAARLFDAETRDVLDFGSAIHALLARVAWIEEADADAIVRQWTATAAGVKEEVRRDVCVQFRAMLQADAVRRALAKPAGRAELWREKAFEIILDGGNWVTGAFDRVTVFRDERGRAVRAAILDYKSDRVDDPRRLDRAAEKYRPQLALYGRALSLILGLPPARIGLQLLFTRPARVVECRPDA